MRNGSPVIFGAPASQKKKKKNSPVSIERRKDVGFYKVMTLCNSWDKHPSLGEAKEVALSRSFIQRDKRFIVAIDSFGGKMMVCYALNGVLYDAEGYLYERKEENDTY